MPEYLVSYVIDVEADSPQEAAEMMRDLLAEPGVAERGAYSVAGPEGHVTIDLSEGGW